ncbi:MAG TPA: hypothetical protein VGB73_04215 [Pyrinomonadaceae bacterium]
MSTYRQQQFHGAPASLSHAVEPARAARIRPDSDWDERHFDWKERGAAAFDASTGDAEEAPDGGEADAGLEDAARNEHEYLRRRLRDELKREPTEEELNEWLRQHTEGH